MELAAPAFPLLCLPDSFRTTFIRKSTSSYLTPSSSAALNDRIVQQIQFDAEQHGVAVGDQGSRGKSQWDALCILICHAHSLCVLAAVVVVVELSVLTATAPSAPTMEPDTVTADYM